MTDARSMLADAGLRITAPRVAVIDVLAGNPHAAADAVFAKVAETLPRTSLQAVYNVLGDLTTRGLARRIEPAGSPARYELRVGDNHHHVVCTSCGKVEDVDCVVGHAPCLVPDQTHDFAIVEAEVTFWGVCKACRQAVEADPLP
ncbi:Fur family transcriptional regulator [Demequina capsici]|uniref:Fur family transcriptional regulator n=2 Tax=Demequina capsici TaxID=3075620 RepID=A0AA96JBX7_9MICO|nr:MULTISPECIES: Fur family transcriptional regulator [unclassified Demequina]WNM26002.1 Fur family transcriptional regulator [Demequina sp. OYTSA14]WNM28875.1 Fur family transcriptional regulator [Demequina sp. PMTSA13]